MIVEENRFWFWLSNLLAILAIHSSVMIPLNCAFVVGDISSWILYCFEILFRLDVSRQFIRVFIQMEPPDLLFFFIEYVFSPFFNHQEAKIHVFIWYSKYLPWFKIARALRVKDLFEKLENFRERFYTPISFLKLLFIQLYCVHLTACIFYHQAFDSLGLGEIKNSWLSSIPISDKNLTEMGIAQMYAVSLYCASVSLSTIGYGDIHPTNVKEMVVIIFLPFFSLFVWTYLGFSIGNLFSRRSRSAIVTEKMNQLDEYFRRNNISEELSREIRDYMVIKYNDEYENKAIQDIPAFMRIKCRDYQPAYSFHCCSPDFIKHLAVKFDQEFYASGSTVAEENSIMKELKIFGGTILEDHVRPTRIFGLESLLLNEALPNTFQACELSRVLSLRKRVYRDLGFLERLTGSDFGLRLEDDDIIKSSMLNNAIFSGNFAKVTSLVQSGVSVNCVDYNKRSPLTKCLLTDCSGATPLRDTIELLKYYFDRNKAGQTPLHIAASGGRFEAAKLLIAYGADHNLKDSSGRLPIEEAAQGQHEAILLMLSGLTEPN
ncbi:hypothetical protein F2Q70_00042076 [Brassica cretica]|uniref:Potassium channel domain-containing protein n=1 Tax=Brassica cretica TaxID=69181 RepID=A0A8S9K6L3_BRACR|nr:hypothetical protein F2Q70_00042076 [Brassica cretica]